METPKTKGISLGKRKHVVLSESDNETVVSEASAGVGGTSNEIDETSSYKMDEDYVLINHLEPDADDWALQVMIVRKTSKTAYSNDKGSGHWMTVILMDEEGTTINAVLYNDVIDSLADRLHQDKVYVIRNGQAKTTKDKFVSSHMNLELKLTTSTTVEETQKTLSPTKITYRFHKFGDIRNNHSSLKRVDVYGGVSKVFTLQTSNRRGNKGTAIWRRITLVNLSLEAMTITLWEDLATNEGAVLEKIKADMPFVAISNLTLDLFAGNLGLATTGATTLIVNPHPDVIANDDNWVSFEKITTEPHARPAKTDPSPTRITLQALRTAPTEIFKGMNCFFDAKLNRILNLNQPWYISCPTCKKKMTPNGEAPRCDKCGTSDSEHRFALRLAVTDAKSEMLVTLFDAANDLLGCTAHDFAMNTDPALRTKLGDLVGHELRFYVDGSKVWGNDRMSGKVVADKAEVPNNGVARDNTDQQCQICNLKITTFGCVLFILIYRLLYKT